MTTSETLFTNFERDENAEIGVMWRSFVTAVGIYVYTNEGARKVSVADVALAFNTTPELAREAVQEHPWLCCGADGDPSQALIESDGE